MELDTTIADGLPFEPKQQDALLGYVLKDKSFMLQVKDRIKGEWFLDGWAGKTYDSYIKFFNKYGYEPKSDEEFLLWEDIYQLPPLERQKVRAAVLKARNETQNFGLELLRESLTGWLQSRVYHQYVNESATLFNNRKFGAAKSILEKAVKELQTIRFDGKPPADFSDPRALVMKILEEGKNALTLGHPLLDKIMNPDCVSGSLLKGDSTVFMSPTNIGKTTTMVTVACANIMRGKHILMITHEGREADIMEKIWLNMMGVSKGKFRQMAISTDPAVANVFKTIAGILKERLVYIDMQRPGQTVEEVVSEIMRHQQRKKAIYGHGFDMCIDDYPAILGADAVKNVRMERRQKDAYVYRYLVDLQGVEQMHGLFAIQTNREGSKVNRQVGEYRNKKFLLTLEYIQEAYEVSNAATNLITINRSPDDQARNLITFLFAKSRSSETNIAVTCRSDFHRGMSHHATLPATWFRGTEALDQLDTLLTEYNGQEVPFDFKERRIK